MYVLPLYQITEALRERSFRVYSKATKQNKLKHKEGKTITKKDKWKWRSIAREKERDDIDGKMFILYKAMWLKGLKDRWTNVLQQPRPNVQYCQGSKEINRQRRQKVGLCCTGEKGWCSSSFWSEECENLAVNKKKNKNVGGRNKRMKTYDMQNQKGKMDAELRTETGNKVY